MAITRAMAAALAVTSAAIGLASPASADDQLDGDYNLVTDGPPTIWTVTTQCNAERTCGGTVATSRGWVGAISRMAGGPWTAERLGASAGWTCPDGSTGPADLLYSFDPVTLAGTVSATSKPGVCNDPNPQQGQQPISLQPAAPSAPPKFLDDLIP